MCALSPPTSQAPSSPSFWARKPTGPRRNAPSIPNSSRVEEKHMFATAEFWVLISFLVFVGVILYYKVPAMVTAALDKRAADIARELDEARRLREEAQALLASYQRKQAEAMQEADAIV